MEDIWQVFVERFIRRPELVDILPEAIKVADIRKFEGEGFRGINKLWMM